MKTRYFTELSYCGSPFRGWQSQRAELSVQSVLQEAFSNVLGETIKITGAGRTDTGVHASYYVAHFDAGAAFDPAGLVLKLNAYLPPEVSIHRILPVAPDAHARFNAESRTYCYIFSRKKDPFLNPLTAYLHGTFNLDAVTEASSTILSFSDFTSFCKLHGGNKTNICIVSEARWYEYKDMLVFTITADRFLRNMVRSLTGALVRVGRGKLSPEEFRLALDSRNNQHGRYTAPACGLYLTGITYPAAYGLRGSALPPWLDDPEQ